MTAAFNRAVTANKKAIRRFLAACGPQDFKAIQRECAEQAYADRASIAEALRQMALDGELTKESISPDDGHGYLSYDLRE